jgi:hypothetical protein
MELLEQPVVRPTLNLSGMMELVPGTLKLGDSAALDDPLIPKLT